MAQQISLAGVRFIVFDAMGVLYRDGDDVAAILIPYLKQHNISIPFHEVVAVYEEAKVGAITSTQLWERLGFSANQDEEYCAHYVLTPYTVETLVATKELGYSLAVLSNDLSEWSRILRHQFSLDAIIPTWVISGDIRIDKPHMRAFDILCETLSTTPDEIMFIDDNPTNIAVARGMGINAVQFGVTEPREWPTVKDMADLLKQIVTASQSL